jgi:hypothetical protein
VAVRGPARGAAPHRRRAHRDAVYRFIDAVGNLTMRSLLGVWLAMVIVCGVAYWIASAQMDGGLRAHDVPVTSTMSGLVTALYFSFVTATSVGYGDVVPMGAVRVLAVAEAAAGLLLFGILISKFVSRRQEILIEQIHRTTFEEHLGRLRTNLHLVLSELQALSELCSGATPSVRVLARVESAGAVFVGELRSIHDLLYRPDEVPDEQVMSGILASLAACLDEFHVLMACLSDDTRTEALRQAVSAMARLANEICGDCVPREYAPEMRVWMDHVQSAAKTLQ